MAAMPGARAMTDDPQYPSVLSFITAMVAVGDRGVALHPRRMLESRIEAVLSMEPVNLDGLIAHHLHLDVADRVPLSFETIAAAVAFIDGHVGQRRRVLVHCAMGISRSPSLVVCYLHQSQGMTIDEAVAHVKSVRPSADPHPELIESIRAYYRENVGRPGVKAPRRPAHQAEPGPAGDK
jgi:predicted protein tyrosine phosphatase